MHAKDLLHEDTEAPAMNCSGEEEPPVCLKCGWQGTVEEHDLSSTQHGGKPLLKWKRIYLDFSCGSINETMDGITNNTSF